jgi:pilus assembly protein CpaB
MAVAFLMLSVVAAGLATVVIFLVFKRLQTELDEANKVQETVAVVVAARNLHQGRTIIKPDLVVKEMPPEYLPETVFTSIDEVLGRTPSERVLEGELLRKERLAKAEAGLGLNAIIPSGKRALSVNIANGKAVAGFLNPGNYVDLLITIKDSEEKAVRTLTMLQALKCLAIDDRLGIGGHTRTQKGKRHGPPSVTFEVTPEEAQRITHANRLGDITLTLRNDIDVTHQETHGARTNALIGRDQIKKVSNLKSRKRTTKKKKDKILIIQGGKIENRTKR